MRLAFATTSRPWADLWQGWLFDHSREHKVVANIADPSTLWDWDWEVLVIDSDSPMFSAALVERVAIRERSLMAIWDTGDPSGKDRALAAGVSPNFLLEANAEPAELLTLLSSNTWTAPVARRPSRRAPVAPVEVNRGLVVAVGGPSDAAADVGIALAAAYAGRHHTVLVDANELYPQVAPALGIAPVPNLAEALRGTDVMSACCPDANAGFWVLAGVADPAQWKDVTEAAETFAALSRAFAVIVMVTGPVIVNDVTRSVLAQRFALSYAAVGAADAVVGVGDGSPTGMVNLARWLEAARSVRPLVPAHLVAVDPPRSRRSEVVNYLAEMGPASPPLIVPGGDDRRSWNGGLPPRPVLRSVATLVGRIGDRP